MADRPGNHKALEEILSATNPEVQERLDGFTQWWEERGDRHVRRMVSRRVAAHLRDDVCQDVAFVAMRAVKQGKYTYQDGKPFEAFVTTITKREIIKTYEASGQQTSLVEMPSSLRDDSQDGSFTELEQRELFNAALAQLKTLPPRRRAVLTLWFEYGLSLQEIAEQLGITYELARKEKSLALRELRQKMSRDLGWTD